MFIPDNLFLLQFCHCCKSRW